MELHERRCPRTGRSLPLRPRPAADWLLSVAGFAALAWFLLRVVPKPTRAAYPCQRAAAPLAAGFVVWAAGLLAPAALLRGARGLAGDGRRHAAWLAATGFAIAAAAAWALTSVPATARATPSGGQPYALLDGPLQPVGVARGIAPGRVVWVHDPKAVRWEMTGSWWEDAYNDQAAIDAMLSRAVQWVTNEKGDAQAWQALFRSYNRTHGRGDAGYKAGEKIAIKVNLNNTTGHGTIARLNTSPHLTLSLVEQLVAAGVQPSAITILDPSRFVPANLYDKIHGPYPEVVFVDHIGGDGRVKADFEPGAIPFSVPGRNASGVATAAVDATYLIDASVLKGHVSSGVTLSAKNLFGLTSINPDWRKNAHDGFDPKRDGTPSYSAFTDFLGHKEMGEKTVLFLMDALYANDLVDDPPHLKWKMAPFDGQWPASLLASQDGVALDSVSLDFLRSEWPNLADLSYCDDYMREAALADHAPSKTVYDPERDGTPLRSLGVHEHWNNAAEKKYSLNLGRSEGIELYTGPR